MSPFPTFGGFTGVCFHHVIGPPTAVTLTMCLFQGDPRHLCRPLVTSQWEGDCTLFYTGLCLETSASLKKTCSRRDFLLNQPTQDKWGVQGV